MSGIGVEEPLESSAAVALQLAASLCREEPRTGERCAWYHGPWQFLRLAGLVMTPAQHADFYRKALDTAASRQASVRVLISAAADYCMLAHAFAALAPRGIGLDITVVDACNTPLALNEWYAERVGCPIRTRQSDILEFEDEPFDVICTHAFLGRFDTADRPKLLARWRELLRAGGAVITVNRIQRTSNTEWTAFRAEEARAFADRVLSHAKRTHPSIDHGELARHVDGYTRRQGAYPVRDREDFSGLFEAAGFVVDELSWAPIAVEDRQDLRGPAVPRSGEYGRIVAIRA